MKVLIGSIIGITLVCSAALVIGFGATPKPRPTPSASPVPSAFDRATQNAMKAATLSQTAQTEQGWSDVAGYWQTAASQMQSVPIGHPKYAIAQQKAGEYRANLVVAQKRSTSQAAVEAKMEAKTPTKLSISQVYTVSSGAVGALSEDDLDKAIGYAAQGDNAAFNQLIKDGRLIRLQPGKRFYRGGCAGLLCSTVKIRPEGKTYVLYTTREMIREVK